MATHCFVFSTGPDTAASTRGRAWRPQTQILHPLALAAGLALGSVQAWAQADLQTVTVSGRSAANSATVAGFGDVPLSRTPFAATVITTRQLQDAGIASLADITLLDASITDAYNAPGYWNQLAVRGFTVDARYNVRRDGLPVNAETVIPTGNKAALEVLKGTSGIQAGTSAPGGLINLVVARPTGRVRSLSLHAEQAGTLGAALDIGDRSDQEGTFGWRVHLDSDRLNPPVRDARGQRWLASAAADWRLAPGRLLEAELETSRQSQPSVPGFSLLGGRLPDARTIDPRINLNNQAWSLPVVFKGLTGSLRYTHDLGAEAQVVAHLMRQQLRTDDRIAFPFGCFAESDYSQYCHDGSFDLYDFRSEGERRTSDAADLSLRGQTVLGGLRHQYHVGVLTSRYQARFNLQAYNYAGTGSIDGLGVATADPSTLDQNTQRDERSTELHLQDVVMLNPQWQLWGGLRHTRLQRDSVRTDGSRASAYGQSFTTPWLALSYAATPSDTAYASYGQGIESEVVPNRPSLYSNAGDVLPTLKSRQLELGFKHNEPSLDWRLAAFDIVRPASNDINGARVIDGDARHTGLEAEAEWRSGSFSLRGSTSWLRARRQNSALAAINGLRPTNVPASSIKLQAAYNVRQVPGLALMGFITHEGERMVLPDNSLSTPSWTRLDIGARLKQQWQGHSMVWRAGLTNLTNRRAWKEAPYQYEHAYLYPLAPRTFSGSVQVGW